MRVEQLLSSTTSLWKIIKIKEKLLSDRSLEIKALFDDTPTNHLGLRFPQEILRCREQAHR